MTQKTNNQDNTNLIEYKRGCHLGYSLGLSDVDETLVKTVMTIASRNKLPLCLGLRKGFEFALKDKKLEKHLSRLQELDKINKQRDKQKGLER